jgi:orotidine-5'-phosphate decarboxylase
VVVGATFPEELAEIRAIAPETPFLVPGIGAQGGEWFQMLLADTEGTALLGQAVQADRLFGYSRRKGVRQIYG